MAAVPDPPPAPVAQIFGSSPVKPSKNVGVHDREEVANKIVPGLLQQVDDKAFLAFLGNKKDLPPGLGRIDSSIDIVSRLNYLSKAVGEKDEGK